MFYDTPWQEHSLFSYLMESDSYARTFDTLSTKLKLWNLVKNQRRLSSKISVIYCNNYLYARYTLL